MPRHGQISSDEEAQPKRRLVALMLSTQAVPGTNANKDANNEALKGAFNGACMWGFPTLAAGFLAYLYSPLYRNVTFQFKVYLQMSSMTVGGIVEADQRYRDFEAYSRRLRKFKRDQEAWKRFEAEFERNSRRK